MKIKLINDVLWIEPETPAEGFEIKQLDDDLQNGGYENRMMFELSVPVMQLPIYGACTCPGESQVKRQELLKKLNPHRTTSL